MPDSTPDVSVRARSTADWASGAPTLAAGEIGIDKDKGEMRIGDGSSVWADLPISGTKLRKGRSTLVAGTVTVAATWVTANTIFQVSHNTLGTVTAPKAVGVTARSAGVSFTITSADNTDTSSIGWIAMEP